MCCYRLAYLAMVQMVWLGLHHCSHWSSTRSRTTWRVNFATLLIQATHIVTLLHSLPLPPKFRSLEQLALLWRVLPFSLVHIVKNIMVRIIRHLFIDQIMTIGHYLRGLYAMQVWEPKSRTLSQGRSKSHPLCNWFVCALSGLHMPNYMDLFFLVSRITKMRENCLKEFETHYNCLEMNNQVRISLILCL